MRTTPVLRVWSVWQIPETLSTVVCVLKAKKANAPVRLSVIWIFRLTFSAFTLLLCLTCTFVHPVPDGHSLTFSGNGYVKYHLMENENKELMKLSLRLRTFSSHATVMYAKGTDYSILEVCANLFSSPIFHSRVFFPLLSFLKLNGKPCLS